MARSLDDLIPIVKEKALKMMELVEPLGFNILIYCTLRTLEEQAVLYRQSRSTKVIQDKIAKFKDRGFGYLANVIEKAGPCDGPHVTNAAPGESWHNYAVAWDAVPIVGGKPVWNFEDNKEAWLLYGECVRKVGMDWAGDWINFKEMPHAQLYPGSNPLKQYTSDKIKELLIQYKLL